MKLPKHTILSLLLGTSTVASASNHFQSDLNTIMQKNGATAASLTIQSPEFKMTYTSGVAKKGDLFEFGSITKSFTAILIVKAINKNILSMNQKISTLFSQFPNWSNVTIFQLLHHTSGIYNITEDQNFLKKAHQGKLTSPFQELQMAYKHSNYFEPGTSYHYTNTGYMLLGIIAEKSYNDSFSNLINNKIFKPLSLTSTIYSINKLTKAEKKHLVVGLNYRGHAIPKKNLSWANSAGAIISTTNDINHYIRSIFTDKLFSKAIRPKLTNIVSKDSGNATNLNKITISSRYYGAGIQLYKDPCLGPVWYHPGGTEGYTSLMMWIPKYELSLAIAINRDLNSHVKAQNLANPILHSLCHK